MNNLNEQDFQTDAKPGEQGYCAPDGTDPENPTELRMPSLSEVTKCQISIYIRLGCCMRAFSMYKASSNLSSLEACPGLM